MKQEIEPFLLLNDLAINCLSREEYAQFLTIMKNIRDRSISVIENLKNEQTETEENTIKYPHDLECLLQLKLFKNNQKGERIELVQYTELPFLLKIPMDQDPKQKITDLYKKITE